MRRNWEKCAWGHDGFGGTVSVREIKAGFVTVRVQGLLELRVSRGAFLSIKRFRERVFEVHGVVIPMYKPSARRSEALRALNEPDYAIVYPVNPGQVKRAIMGRLLEPPEPDRAPTRRTS